jgi:hypothetical protein
MRQLQSTADDYVIKNFTEPHGTNRTFANYQSLVKYSERISTGISKVRPEAMVAKKVTQAGGMVVDEVKQAGGMARRTLSGVLEAGEVAAKVMRFRL